MESNLDLINKLESNIKYDNYEYCVDNVEYILYRTSFNLYLKKFIDKCFKYDIKLFFKNNNMIYILTKNDIINQINNVIKKLINDNFCNNNK
jgi:hypothetical protein